MMGGAWYDEYFGNKSEDEIYSIGLGEVKRQLNVQIDPDIYQISILKVTWNENLFSKKSK